MKDIIKNSSSKRVFYFHGFIYFIPTIKKIDDNQIDLLIHYILDLLIFFDEILIPSEHLTISNNELEYNFKVKFLSNLIIQQLIESKKIVTTIWSACDDSIQHYEVVDRYMNIIGAKQYYYFKQIKPYIMNIPIYQRNATYQSNKAKNYTDEKKYYDELLYEDNSITIGFSHEKLLLGKLKDKIIDSNFIKTAKQAYIKAMPDGNGRVYRSLIYEIEEIKFQNTIKYIPINEPSDINPVLLTGKYYTMLLYKIGIRRNKNRNSHNWIKEFIAFSNLNIFQKDKEEFFNLLKYLSNFSLMDDIEVKYAINSIYIKKINFDFISIFFNIQNIISHNIKKIFYIRNDFINTYNKLNA